MSDYSELKRLAEAATIGDKPASTPIKELIGAQDAFRSECRPKKVLALIAENERLGLELKDFQWGASVEAEAADEARTEVSKLRAEVAGLKTGYQAYERVNAELKAEVEALRKERDSRHPFKFAQESPAIGFTGCVICGVFTDHGGLPCPKMSPAAMALSMESQRVTPVEPLRTPHPLEAAMGKGEQS